MGRPSNYPPPPVPLEEVRKMLRREPSESRLALLSALLWPTKTGPCEECGQPTKRRAPAVITPEQALHLMEEMHNG
jgi:hypothetical protein